MCLEYDIMMSDKIVGQATLTQKGLYCFISCKCTFEDKRIYRVRLESKNKALDLGICVPEANIFTLNRMIPVKKIDQGALRFYAGPAYPERSIVPVFENEAFDDLYRVSNGQLEMTQGQVKIAFTDPAEVPRDNDQSP